VTSGAGELSRGYISECSIVAIVTFFLLSLLLQHQILLFVLLIFMEAAARPIEEWWLRCDRAKAWTLQRSLDALHGVSHTMQTWPRRRAT